MLPMRIAMIAPPWISIPPAGYGGIENVIKGLVDGLVKNGIEVELFTAGNSQVKGCKIHKLYKTEQREFLHRPWYESVQISIAHVQNALKLIESDGQYDLIHDHNQFVGPVILNWATRLNGLPPSVHTYHGPPFTSGDRASNLLPESDYLWDDFNEESRSYFIGISNALMQNAPEGIRKKVLECVHNAVDANDYKFQPNKKEYFITLARFSPDKGQHIAIKHCIKNGFKLRMAGTCAGMNTTEELLLELLNPESEYRRNADFRYYSDAILPATILNKSIRNVGNVSGNKKRDFIADAKALLFPIDWEEPFGMSVIEALASGTPVVAMNKGAMPEIIEHGVNGFLANSDEEFGEYMKHVGDIDPYVCRKSVESRFSIDAMATNYIKRYRQVMEMSTI